MVMLDALPGVELKLIVNDEEAVEWENSELVEAPRTVSRFVEVAVGDYWALEITLHPNFSFKGNRMQFDIWVDGQLMEMPLMGKNSRTERYEGHTSANGKSIQKFRFTARQTADAGSVQPEDFAGADELGTIWIEACHRRLGKVSRRKVARPVVVPTPVLSEEVARRRGISHNVELAEEVPRLTKMEFHNSYRVPGVPNPAGSFVFHYRDLATLQSANIIPRTPPRADLLYGDVDTFSREDKLELQRRAKAQQEEADEALGRGGISRPSMGTPIKVEDAEQEPIIASTPPRPDLLSGDIATFSWEDVEELQRRARAKQEDADEESRRSGFAQSSMSRPIKVED